MSDFEKFHLDLEAVNEGVKMPLLDSDNELTEEWILVRSKYSTIARKAMDLMKREMRERHAAGIFDNYDLMLTAQVSLVANWSNDQECTPDNVRDFLMNAPQEAERLDLIAGTTNLFFRNSAEDS